MNYIMLETLFYFAKSAKIDFNLCMIDMGLTRENVTQLGH